MKRILTILILFVCGTASAQVYQRMPQYGYEMQRAKMDSVLQVPGDTVRNKTGVARIGTKLYAGNGTYWTEAGGTTIDTTGIRLQATAGPGISITGTYPNLTFSGNPDTLTAADPLQLSTVSTKKVRLDFRRDWLDSLLALQVDSSGLLDSALLRNDSLFTYTGGVESYRGKVSGGGGGTLQEAYDNSTAPQINTNNGAFNILGDDGYIKYDFAITPSGTALSHQLSDNSGIGSNIQLYREFLSLNFTDYNLNNAQLKADTANLTFSNTENSAKVGINTTTQSATLHIVSPDSNALRIVAPLSSTVLATDSALVIGTDGNVKKAAKASGGSGITTAQLTDSLNNREPRYKFRNDSTGNAGYTTLYQNGLKANIASPTFIGSLALSSTTGGIGLPAMTQTQMDAISTPAVGVQVYNTTYDAVCTNTSEFGWWSNDAAWLTYNGWDSRNEFIATGNNTSTTTVGDFIALIANSGLVSSAAATANRPGVIQLSTFTSSTARASLVSDVINSNTVVVGGGKLLFEGSVQIPTLHSAAEAYRFHFGFSTSTQAVQTSSIAFLYDSAAVNTGSAATGRWQVVCAKNNSRSYTTTDSVVTAGRWYNLKAVINAAATQVDFYINGTLVKSETNNIPTANMTPMASIVKANGTTARTIWIDYIRMRQKFTTPRP